MITLLGKTAKNCFVVEWISYVLHMHHAMNFACL